jgi:hypothetical protein
LALPFGLAGFALGLAGPARELAPVWPYFGVPGARITVLTGAYLGMGLLSQSPGVNVLIDEDLVLL